MNREPGFMELPTTSGYYIVFKPEHVESVHLNEYADSSRIVLHIYINHKAYAIAVDDSVSAAKLYLEIVGFMRARHDCD